MTTIDLAEPVLDTDRLTSVFVRSILKHPHEHLWKLQDIGVLGLCLGDLKEYRLHV